MSYIEKEIVREQIALAYKRAADKGLSRSSMKNMAIVGPPGSRKTKLFNMVIEQCPDYEKAVPVTNRALWPNEKSDTHLFTDKKLIDAEQYLIIDGTVYIIGDEETGDEHATPLSEITRIIAKGKKFITFTDIKGALALKKILADDLMVVYLEASMHDREANLKNKMHKMLLNATDAEKTAVLKKIPAYLDFGTKEMQLYKRIVADEKKQSEDDKKAGLEPKPLTFYSIEGGKTFNPHKAVQFILDNAQARYQEAC